MKLAAKICSTILGVLLLYVLSIGPAYRVWVWDVTLDALDERQSKLQTYRRVYAPLLWLYENSAMAKGALDWYGNLWVRNAPRPN